MSEQIRENVISSRKVGEISGNSVVYDAVLIFAKANKEKGTKNHMTNATRLGKDQRLYW
jgi:hypothetical protein